MAEITKKDAVPTNPLMLRITEGKNPRGIPTAKFIVRRHKSHGIDSTIIILYLALFLVFIPSFIR